MKKPGRPRNKSAAETAIEEKLAKLNEELADAFLRLETIKHTIGIVTELRDRIVPKDTEE